MKPFGVVSVLIAVSVTGCAAGQVPELATTTTTTTTTMSTPVTTTLPAVTTEPPVVPPELEGWEVRPVAIEDGELTYLLSVAVADTAQKRAQGLMGVVDLGDLDGMLFVYSDLTSGTFWMKDTLIPLDIAFFAPDGSWVNNFTMLPCTDEECPNYSAEGQYQYAIEVPDAGFATLTPGARLRLDL